MRTRGGQLVTYADDVVLIAKQRRIMEKILEDMVTEWQKLGLKISKAKIK